MLISAVVYALCFQYEEQTKYKLKDKNNIYRFVSKQLNQSPTHIKFVIIVTTWIMYFLSFLSLYSGMLKMSAIQRSYFIGKQKNSILMPMQKCIQFYESLVIIRFMQIVEIEANV
jgi:hypothetical protein